MENDRAFGREGCKFLRVGAAPLFYFLFIIPFDASVACSFCVVRGGDVCVGKMENNKTIFFFAF